MGRLEEIRLDQPTFDDHLRSILEGVGHGVGVVHGDAMAVRVVDREGVVRLRGLGHHDGSGQHLPRNAKRLADQGVRVLLGLGDGAIVLPRGERRRSPPPPTRSRPRSTRLPPSCFSFAAFGSLEAPGALVATAPDPGQFQGPLWRARGLPTPRWRSSSERNPRNPPGQRYGQPASPATTPAPRRPALHRWPRPASSLEG